MIPLEGKHVLVLGLGRSGLAATRLLQGRGAQLLVVDSARNPELEQTAAQLKAEGVRVELGVETAPAEPFDLVVVSPGVPWTNPVLIELSDRNVPIIGEFELGYQHALCLNVVPEQLRRFLLPDADQTRELDFLTLEVSSFQLETIRFFRPAVAVLLNITPDHLDRYSGMADYALAKARLFMNQQPFDWAIIQSEALAQLRALQVNIPSKVITFSAANRRADLTLDRTLLVSKLDGWTGPLLNLEDCRFSGPHNAENAMAALAVGRVLRIPLETMVEALKSYQPAAHRCELVAEINGVKYVNDSKATNLDALQKALLSMPQGRSGEPNVWLIAGGRDKAFEYYEVGPLLSQWVKGAFLIGETREKIRAAWSLFTPCTAVDSLLEAIAEAARSAVAGDVVLLSPACSSFDQFRNYQHRGEVFRQAVRGLQDQAGQTQKP